MKKQNNQSKGQDSFVKHALFETNGHTNILTKGHIMILCIGMSHKIPEPKNVLSFSLKFNTYNSRSQQHDCSLAQLLWIFFAPRPDYSAWWTHIRNPNDKVVAIETIYRKDVKCHFKNKEKLLPRLVQLCVFKDLLSWNVIIKDYIKHGKTKWCSLCIWK